MLGSLSANGYPTLNSKLLFKYCFAIPAILSLALGVSLVLQNRKSTPIWRAESTVLIKSPETLEAIHTIRFKRLLSQTNNASYSVNSGTLKISCDSQGIAADLKSCREVIKAVTQLDHEFRFASYTSAIIKLKQVVDEDRTAYESSSNSARMLNFQRLKASDARLHQYQINNSLSDQNLMIIESPTVVDRPINKQYSRQLLFASAGFFIFSILGFFHLHKHYK
jgi:hypothetical protein